MTMSGAEVPLRFKSCRQCRRQLSSYHSGAEIESLLGRLSTVPACSLHHRSLHHRSSKRVRYNREERRLLLMQRQHQQQQVEEEVEDEQQQQKKKNKRQRQEQQQRQQQQQQQQQEEEIKRAGSGSSSSSSNGESCEEEEALLLRQGDDDGSMPPSGSLPEDLIDRILCRLPVPALARLQLVCKHWRAKVSSTDSTFLRLYAQNPQPRNPWLVVNKHSRDFHGLSAFDPCAKRWFRIPFSFEGMPWKGFMCAASGGLFCLLNQSGKHPRTGLVVCNPLTRQWRTLPALPVTFGNGGVVVAMTTDPGTAAYKVVVMTDVEKLWNHGLRYLTLVYDSASGAWQTKNIGLTRYSTYDTWRSFVSNGTLYALCQSGKSLLSYNLEADSWTETYVEEPTRQFDWEDWVTNIGRFPFIVECQGRLFLVARLKRGGSLGTLKQQFSLGRLPITLHNIVGLWELRIHPVRLTHKWKLVTYTPFDLMEEVVVASEGTDFLVASDGDRCIWLVLAGSHSMLTYDVDSRKWSLQKPGCPGEDCLDARLRKAVFAPLMWTASV